MKEVIHHQITISHIPRSILFSIYLCFFSGEGNSGEENSEKHGVSKWLFWEALNQKEKSKNEDHCSMTEENHTAELKEILSIWKWHRYSSVCLQLAQYSLMTLLLLVMYFGGECYTSQYPVVERDEMIWSLSRHILPSQYRSHFLNVKVQELSKADNTESGN